ncbi:MAG: hypothetical protein II984_11095 [Clostridia bacterium]|nr:hypothetical protein [Clostridia bacterium]
MKKIYLILAVIFLFNPIISVIDVLPDFIGYLLLLKFFHKMSYTNDNVNDLCRSIKILSLITGLKIISLLLMPTLAVLDQAMYLVFSFAFAILECVFGIPLINKLFDTFSDISLYENNIECANNTIVKNLTIGAFVTRLVLASLPDFTFLSISNGVDTQTGINLLQFRSLLFTLSVFISLIVGIVWIIFILRYINRLFTKNAIRLLKEDYSQRAIGRGLLFLSRDSMFYLTVLCLASALVVDFNLNLVNILLDSIFSVIITVVLVLMSVKDYYKEKLMLVIIGILSVFHLAVDITLSVKAIKFFEKYNLDSILRVSKAEDMYFSMCTYATISAVLFVVIVFLSTYSLYRSAEDTLLSNSGLFVDASREALREEFKKDTKRNITHLIIFSVISGIVYCCYIFFRHLLPVTTLFNSIAEIAFIFAFVKAMLYLYDNVYKRINTHA